MQANEKRSFSKDIASVFGSNVFAIFNALLIDIVLSRQLGPEGRGLYSSILVVPVIVSAFVLLGIRRSAVYHLGRKEFDANRIVSAIISISALTSILAVVLSLIGYIVINTEGLTPFMVILSLLSIPLKLFLVYSGGIYIGIENFKRSNLLNWLPLLLNLMGILVFVSLIKWDVTGALLALFISNLGVAIFTLKHLASNFTIRLKYDVELWRKLIGMGFVFAFAMVVMQLNYRIDILLLQELANVREVGFYSLGVAISDKLWQLPTAVGIVVMSRAAGTRQFEKLDKEIAALLRVSFLIVLVAAILLWFVIPYLIPAFFGQSFSPSSAMVQLMLPGIVMFAVVRILSGRFAGAGEPRSLIGLFIPALIINVVLNLIWIPKYGGLGAAMATNVSYSFGAIGMMVLFSLKSHMSLFDIMRFQKSDFGLIRNIFKRRIKL